MGVLDKFKNKAREAQQKAKENAETKKNVNKKLKEAEHSRYVKKVSTKHKDANLSEKELDYLARKEKKQDEREKKRKEAAKRQAAMNKKLNSSGRGSKKRKSDTASDFEKLWNM